MRQKPRYISTKKSSKASKADKNQLDLSSSEDVREIKQIIEDLDSSILSSQVSSASSNKASPKAKLENIFYCKIGEHIAYRYEIMEEIGKGAFGKVSFFFLNHRC